MNDEHEALTFHPIPPLPDRDYDKLAEDQGLFRKFLVYRTDGSDAPGRKHHGCEYFVLDVNHDPHAGAALKAYSESCKTTHPVLSAEMLTRYAHLMPPDGEAVKLILEALHDWRKTINYDVCQKRWKDATPEYMTQELAVGMTRQAYLDICKTNAERVDRAIAWVKSCASQTEA